MFGWGPKSPSAAQRELGNVLFNESIHVLSTFELNRIASLTYGDDVCDEIFEMLEGMMRNPLEYSVLAVQKSLVIAKHIMIYGSEKCVNSALVLRRAVEELQEFNTVLWAQRLQGASAIVHRLKGGGVDKGYPVREAAKEVLPLYDMIKLREMRNSKADPNSLVPIGDDKVAFLSDDVRLFMLKKRIKEQYHLQTKSNLASETGGFGSGYVAQDGKTVVGAAHGLEEMIKQAEIANRKFTDSGEPKYQVPKLSDFAEVSQSQSKDSNCIDLLFENSGSSELEVSQPVGDLLDFSQPQPATGAACEADLFGSGVDLLAPAATVSSSIDPFLDASSKAAVQSTGAGMPSGATAETIGIFLNPSDVSPSDPSSSCAPPTGGLLDFASVPAISLPQSTEIGDSLLNTLDGPAPAATVISRPELAKKSIMGSNSDRFAALDSLEVPGAMINHTILSAKEAENKLLGLSGSASNISQSSLPSDRGLNGSITNPSHGDDKDISSSLQGMSLGMDMRSPDNLANLSNVPPSSQRMDLYGGPPAFFSSSGSGGGLKVAQSVPLGGAEIHAGDDGDGDGFVMGGTAGSGLEPTAAAPAAPPPPPPPPTAV